MGTKATLTALAAMLLVISIATITVDADWSGTAEVSPVSVYLNFQTSFTVKVTNTGATPLEVKSVTLNINWPGSLTKYPVFSGSAVLNPGESRTFDSGGLRMPDTDPGTYPYFVSVTARAQGDSRDFNHRFSGNLTADRFGLTIGGIPEVILVPLMFTAVILLAILVLFRFERNRGRWPLFEAVPRWQRRQDQGRNRP